MPFYGDREYLEKLRKRNVCAVCGGPIFSYVDITDQGVRFYLKCPFNGHDGIAREFRGNFEPNIQTLREELEMTMGKEKATALAKYAGRTELVRNEAREILVSLFPKAPKVEVEKAILTCVSYRLNPLNKHLFLIPFNEGKKNETWAQVMGIKAKRLLANRPVPGTKEARPFSYLDNTPRVMTTEEQMKIYGEIQQGMLMSIVILQDPKTGATVPGYGAWPLKKTIWENNKKVEVDNDPYGKEHGNSMSNMSFIRAESQALDRLRPGEMPEGVMTVDDRVIDGEFKVVDEKQLEIPEVNKQVSSPTTSTPTEHGNGQDSQLGEEEDISWEDLQSASKPPETTETTTPSPDFWTYAEVAMAVKTLQEHKVAAVIGQAFADRMNKDFKVELPPGKTLNLKTVYELLTPEKKKELCMWLADLRANEQSVNK